MSAALWLQEDFTIVVDAALWQTQTSCTTDVVDSAPDQERVMRSVATSDRGADVRTGIRSEDRTSGGKRVPELDGIRGLAILLVLLWHYCGCIYYLGPAEVAAGMRMVLSLTWAGVDVFFVLSGFLIGGILLDHRGQPGYFTAFYARRFCRILPAYLLLLIVFVLLVVASNPATTPNLDWLLGTPMPMWSYWLYVQNVLMAIKGGFGANALGVTWSLAVEEQFYLILPILVFQLRPVRLRWVLWILIVAAPLLRFGFYHTYWPGWFAGAVVCRWDGLLLGVLGAMLVRHPPARQYLQSHPGLLRLGLGAFLLSAAVIIFLGQSAHYNPLMNSVGYTWLAVGALILILAGVLRSSSRLSGCLTQPWLRGLGGISYGVYLYHQLMLGLCHGVILGRRPEIRSLTDVGVTLLALGLTLGLASFSWRLFERHWIARGHQVQYDRAGELDVKLGAILRNSRTRNVR